MVPHKKLLKGNTATIKGKNETARKIEVKRDIQYEGIMERQKQVDSLKY